MENRQDVILRIRQQVQQQLEKEKRKREVSIHPEDVITNPAYYIMNLEGYAIFVDDYEQCYYIDAWEGVYEFGMVVSAKRLLKVDGLDLELQNKISKRIKNDNLLEVLNEQIQELENCEYQKELREEFEFRKGED